MKKVSNEKFQIGDLVKINKIALYSTEEDGTRKIVYQPVENCFGIITGKTVCYEGKIESIQEDNNYGFYNYLNVRNGVELFEFKRGFVNNAEHAYVDDIELCADFVLPYKYTGNRIFSEEYRQMMRDEMATYPRDEKGRWVKLESEYLSRILHDDVEDVVD